MRTFLKVLLAGAGLAVSSLSAQAVEINMLTWGGHYLDTFQPVAREFEKETGHRVNLVVQSGAKDGLTKIMAQRGNPQIDVWLSIDSTATAAAEAGLLADLDPALIPNMKVLPQGMTTRTSLSVVLSPRGIAYRKDLTPFPISDWKDLWDSRLKNKVGMSFVIDTGTPLIMAALLNGGSEKDIEPGFTAMKALKPNLAGFFKTDNESVKYLESGEFAVIGYSVLANFYLKLGPDSNIQFVIPDKPKFLAAIPAAIVKGRGTEREKVAHQFVNYLLEPKAQEFITGRFGQIPVNPAAKLPGALQKMVPELPLQNVYSVDWDIVNTNYQAWNRRWNEEIQSR
jgi:putative spermidine/putrescine transport system substrate-binding protein